MTDNAPLHYIERIREYYQILGYGRPYRWVHYDDVPFAPLNKPLTEAVIGIVTTAAPFQPDRAIRVRARCRRCRVPTR